MQTSEFSETQFVVGFLREFLNSHSQKYWIQNFLRLPSTVTERKTGADVIIQNVSGSDFFQFKRSDYLKNRRGLPWDQRQIAPAFFECYRFHIYNTQRTRQFETLRNLAKKAHNYCAYIAPLFYTFDEFDHYFQRHNVMRNAIEIECSQFSKGEFANFRYRYNQSHHLLYNRHEICFFCSQPLKTKAKLAISLKERGYKESINFLTHIDEIYSILKQMDYLTTDQTFDTTQQKIQVIFETLYRKTNIIWIPRFLKAEHE